MGLLSSYLLLLSIFCLTITFTIARSVGHGLEGVEEAGEGGDGGDELDLEAVGLGDQDLQQRQTRLKQRECQRE